MRRVAAMIEKQIAIVLQDGKVLTLRLIRVTSPIGIVDGDSRRIASVVEDEIAIALHDGNVLARWLPLRYLR